MYYVFELIKVFLQPSFKQRRNQFAAAVSLLLLSHVMSTLRGPGLQKLRNEMAEWILSREIASGIH